MWLQHLGADLTGYAMAPVTQLNLFELAQTGRGMHSVIADIRDLTALRTAIEEAQPDILLHLAAQPLVRASYIDPVLTYSTNVMGTVHVLEAVRYSTSVKAVVIVTTDKCYENREWHWAYRENDPMGGHDPYSNSKGCAELVTAAYRSSYFSQKSHPAVATARAGNVIGGGDWSADRLIPDAIAAFSKQEVLQLRHPQAIRPWQHVLEPLRGYLMLAEALFEQGQSFAQAWNFGPYEEDAQTVGQIVERLSYLWGSDARSEILTTNHPHEATYLKLDISKAKSLLHWHPKLHLAQALELTVSWSKKMIASQDVRSLCLQQIQHYEQLL